MTTREANATADFFASAGNDKHGEAGESGVEVGFEVLEGGVGPGVGGFEPGFALLGYVVGEVHAAEAAVGGEVEEGLSGSVEVEDGLLAVGGPLDGGEALGLRVFEGANVVDEHAVEDGVFLGLAGTVAGVEVAGQAFVFEDDGPGDDRGG